MPNFEFYCEDDNVLEYNQKLRDKKHDIEIDQYLANIILWCFEFAIENLEECKDFDEEEKEARIYDMKDFKMEFLKKINLN